MNMDAESIRMIAFASVVAGGMIAPSLAVGWIGSTALNAIGRNPQAEAKIRTAAILFIAFAEALAIFALVSGFIINFVK